MKHRKNRIPFLFWLASGFLLLLHVVGISSFFQLMFMSEEALEALTEGQRDIVQHLPVWVLVVFGIVVFSGTFGCIALLVKKRFAKTLFITSLTGFVILVVRSLMVGDFEVYGTPEMIIILAIFGFLFFAIWLSRRGAQKNWLR